MHAVYTDTFESFPYMQNFAPWHSSSSFADAFVSDTVDEELHRPELVDSDDGEDGEDWETTEEEMADDGEPHEDEPISESDANTQSIPITEQSIVSVTVPEPSASLWTGYKIVGDNADKNVRRSFQRVGYTTQSLHYFNAYAALDRIDFSGLSNEVPLTVVDPISILPTSDDICVLEDDFRILTSRYVCACRTGACAWLTQYIPIHIFQGASAAHAVLQSTSQGCDMAHSK